jgi:hypothetical protein
MCAGVCCLLREAVVGQVVVKIAAIKLKIGVARARAQTPVLSLPRQLILPGSTFYRLLLFCGGIDVLFLIVLYSNYLAYDRSGYLLDDFSCFFLCSCVDYSS